MNQIIPVLKDEVNQQPIPTEWRATFAAIVDTFKKKDFNLKQEIANVRSVNKEDAVRIEKNIERYGAQLVRLPEATWDTSACQWMRGYWDAQIDLFTIEEGRSDLILAVRVYEENSAYIFEIQSVHVL